VYVVILFGSRRTTDIAQLCVVLLSKPTNSHWTSGSAPEFVVLKVLTEVVKFSIHNFNYTDKFFK